MGNRSKVKVITVATYHLLIKIGHEMDIKYTLYLPLISIITKILNIFPKKIKEKQKIEIWLVRDLSPTSPNCFGLRVFLTKYTLIHSPFISHLFVLIFDQMRPS